MKEFFGRKKILVTGGTGSIGSEIVRRLLPCEPATLRVLSRDETKQLQLEQELGSRADLRYLIGDVRDSERLRRAMRKIDFVFHAAAMKHVPACEYNPFEAVQTNVVGTQRLIQAAIDAGVERLVAISTDKAVDPSNTMGATKLLAEKLVGSAQFFVPEVVLANVRFGNVLGSRGSILPILQSQIEKGGPVTLTDPAMTRFVMPIERATWLVLAACRRAKGGETFILRMPALRIVDLVEVAIEELAPRFGRRPSEIRIDVVGKRPGEKIHEALLTDEESSRVVLDQDMFVLPMKRSGLETPCDPALYRSEKASLLDKAEIRRILRECHAL